MCLSNFSWLHLVVSAAARKKLHPSKKRGLWMLNRLFLVGMSPVTPDSAPTLVNSACTSTGRLGPRDVLQYRPWMLCCVGASLGRCCCSLSLPNLSISSLTSFISSPLTVAATLLRLLLSGFCASFSPSVWLFFLMSALVCFSASLSTADAS